MNVARGIVAAFVGAVSGILFVILVVSICTISSWYLNNVSAFDREYDIAWWYNHAIPPLVGIATYVGLAAFATYAPDGNYRFARTLTIIFFFGILFTCGFPTLELTPRAKKAHEIPYVSFPELLRIVLPPLITTLTLITVRCSGAYTTHVANVKPNESQNGSEEQQSVTP